MAIPGVVQNKSKQMSDESLLNEGVFNYGKNR
jgi:hypothetical protein